MATARIRLSAVLVLVATAVAATVVSAVSTDDRRSADAAPEAAAAAPPPAPAAGTVELSLSDCGSGWAPGPAGPQEIVLHNADYHAGELRVVGVGADNRREVFAQVEPFGPGTTVTVHVRLAAGQYALQCLYSEQSPLTGPTRTITGDASGVRGVVPIPQDKLIRATLRYTAIVRGRLPQLVEETRSLAGAVHAGDLGRARGLWLRAHAAYERLGAAYEAFGDLDGVINGLPAGLPGGVRDPGFTGFHRVELGLWGADRRDLGHQADVLADAVVRLRRQLATTQLDPLTFTIRAHEITENLLRPVLTGAADLGSHSDLATVLAGLSGTATVLDLVRKPLRSRYPHVRGLYRRLGHARLVIGSLVHGRLGRTAVAEWPLRQRQRVDALIADLAERLAPVASVLEPRRVT